MKTDRLSLLQQFCVDNDLRSTISNIEIGLQSCSIRELKKRNYSNQQLLKTAFQIKKIVGPINIIIHAWGILSALPYILESKEVIEGLSLGAGNSGKRFDLVTDKRVAEFKFITWKGKAEAIRQNNVFADFFNLAEYQMNKTRNLYVIDKQIPLKFFNGQRAIKSVLSKNSTISKAFYRKYKNKYSVVAEYYNDHKHLVSIIDLREVAPDIFCEYL